jgi:hypothetical protein
MWVSVRASENPTFLGLWRGIGSLCGRDAEGCTLMHSTGASSPGSSLGCGLGSGLSSGLSSGLGSDGDSLGWEGTSFSESCGKDDDGRGTLVPERSRTSRSDAWDPTREADPGRCQVTGMTSEEFPRDADEWSVRYRSHRQSSGAQEHADHGDG